MTFPVFAVVVSVVALVASIAVFIYGEIVERRIRRSRR